MFKKIDEQVDFHFELSPSATLLLEDVHDFMKTVVVQENNSGDLWIYQSSCDDGDGETEVDCVRLEKHVYQRIFGD